MTLRICCHQEHKDASVKLPEQWVEKENPPNVPGEGQRYDHYVDTVSGGKNCAAMGEKWSSESECKQEGPAPSQVLGRTGCSKEDRL